MTAAEQWEPGAAVEVFYGQAWYRGAVVPIDHPERLGWWPGVDFRRAVAVLIDPGTGFPGSSRRRPWDLLIPDPDSPCLRAPGGGKRPRLGLGVVS